jgi:protein phosphatase
MVAMANAMGGRDNISVVLAQTQLAQDAKKRGGLMARLLRTS